MKVKALTCRDPDFLKQTYKYDHIIDLINSDMEVKKGEKYIKYDGHWRVYKMGFDRTSRAFGQYKTLFGAVYKCRVID